MALRKAGIPVGIGADGAPGNNDLDVLEDVRLAALLQSFKHGPGALSDADLAEVGRLYRAAATRLAQARSLGGSASRVELLNRLVARGHGVLYGRPQKGSSIKIVLWIPLLFPEVVRATWPFHLAAALLILIGGYYGFRGTMKDPEWY